MMVEGAKPLGKLKKKKKKLKSPGFLNKRDEYKR